MSGRIALLVAVLAAPLAGGAAVAAPPEDRVLPVEQYTTEKARRLARTHAGALRALATTVYHCLPWVETDRHSIGFFRPRHAAGDDRYLSIRLYVEQDPSPQFAALSVGERASSMFSRYVGPLLQRMTRNAALVADAALAGFTVIVEWLKQAPATPRARPVHETIAAFVDKPTAVAFVRGDISTAELAARARVLGFDGETPLGPLRLAGWEDDFVATYRLENYQVAAGVTCP